MMAQGYQVFHLNLAFSSIPSENRCEVIRKCYWPLLDYAIKGGIPIGIELSGWTLEQIDRLDPKWVECFSKMLENKQCELIGSGWSQIIGPLVPYEVNSWNQKLGLDAYERLLGIRPDVALINEMAYSTAMVDLYAEAGYRGIIMDRDNVRLALGLNNKPLSATPTHAQGCCNEVALPILWADSILLQRLQRVVHGDIPLSEYMEYLKLRVAQDEAVLPIYCNDAEVFDFRPGRFEVESRLHAEGEWDRLLRISDKLRSDFSLNWLRPSDALDILLAATHPYYARLSSVYQPIPVKKQAKYNVLRWAVSGRDNLWLNTACHRIYQGLISSGDKSPERWKDLCNLWASDLRTHITDGRWIEATALIESKMSCLQIQRNDRQPNTAARIAAKKLKPKFAIDRDEEDIFWMIKTENIHLTLNTRRGLVIKSLAFKSQNFKPILVTLAQGFFTSIELGADFYSGGVLIEIPGERTRLTDLDWVQPQIEQQDAELIIKAEILLNSRKLIKTIAVDLVTERIRLGYDFGKWPRPVGTVRAGFLTLNPEIFKLPLSLLCLNGGKTPELFLVEQDVNHGRAVSTIVSCNGGFGATDGKFAVSDPNGFGFKVLWNPAECAAVPLFQYQQSGRHFLSRLFFSMCEIDDTFMPGGRLLPFNFSLIPLKKQDVY